MRAITELEKEILALSPSERERLAMVAWESLVNDPTTAGNREIDPQGIRLATQRDAEIESGNVQPIDHAEFLRRTAGKPESVAGVSGLTDEKDSNFFQIRVKASDICSFPVCQARHQLPQTY